jgi:hypothetical protein
MKKLLTVIIMAICISHFFSSCATVLGGRVSDLQRTKPKEGEPARAIRGGALVADILLFWPGTFVDFATGAIYKPNKK